MSELLLPCPFESDVSLASLSYYGIGGISRFLAHPQTPAELANLLLYLLSRHCDLFRPDAPVILDIR